MARRIARGAVLIYEGTMVTRSLVLALVAIVVSTSVFGPGGGHSTRHGTIYNTWLLQSSPRDQADPTPLSIRPEPSKVSELGAMLDKLPTADKYALMIQSYATGILERTNRDAGAMDAIESLYLEMLAESVRPTEQTSQSLIDSAASFCNSAKLGRALQLGRASGSIRAFGAATGLLTTPITSASVASTLFITSPKLPTDDREREVFSAASVGITGISYLALQLVSVLDSDAHPWATLLGVAALAAGSADVAFTQGKNLKCAAAGFERLALRDKERDAYTESSAFLVGYLLGLPCFCFQPDVSEALKLLRTCPGALGVYKQPAAKMASAAAAAASKSGGASRGAGGAKSRPELNIFGPALGGGGANKASKAPPTPSSSLAVRAEQGKAEINARLLRQFLDVDAGARADLLGLSRLLVWLAAPVAAETLKYGRSVVSDPRRCGRLLNILENLQAASAASAAEKDKDRGRAQRVPAVKGSAAGAGSSTAASAADEGTPAGSNASSDGDSDGGGLDALDGLVIPASQADKEALVLWAYNEAIALIRQYGELVEGVSSYISSGTTTVGECALLIEGELR